MVTVAAADARIRIVAGVGHPVLAGVHRAYFETILNLRSLPSADGYAGDSEVRLGELLGDVCKYLDAQGIEYTLDPNAALLRQRAEGAALGLAESIAAGRDVLAAAPEAIEIEGFRRPLLPHQWTPVRHLLAVKHGANFSVMGSGKTTVVLATFQELRRRGEIDCLLVIGPTSAFLSWEDEVAQCLPPPTVTVRLTGTPEERTQRYLQASNADVVLLTYHTSLRDEGRVRQFLRSRRVMLVLDESHYIKGNGVIPETMLNLAPEAAKRIVLTGTPLPNSMRDLWTPFTFLWPDQHLLGNRVQFRSQLSAAGGEDLVKARVRPLFSRVGKSDLRLPPPRFRVVNVSTGSIQGRIYNTLAARTLQELGLQPEDRALIRQWRRARMVRLLQAATNPALIADPSEEFSLPSEPALDTPLVGLVQQYTRYEVPPKIVAAVDLVRRLVAQGQKVVVWTHFIRNIDLLLTYLSEYDPLPLYGAVPREELDDDTDYNRENHIRRFRSADDSCRVLVANPGAAAESISLHKVCHHAVYLDRTFNAGQFMQSRDRIHRVGMPAGVTVNYHLLVTEGTIDEVVHARLLAKETRMLALLDDPNIPVVELPVSTDQLSGTEGEEALDFDAVIEHLRRATNGE